MIKIFLLLVFVAVAPWTTFASEGEELFKASCAVCHRVQADAQPLVGPNLHGVVDRPVAATDFRYSDALMRLAEQSTVWTAENLDRFLASPAEFAPGTSMGLAGLSHMKERQMLIDWLASLAMQDTDSTMSDPDVDRILGLNADTAYGEYLATECVTCHSAGAPTTGVPSIHGKPAEFLIGALLAYKRGERENNVMQLMAGNMGDDEMAAIASYFSNLQ